ncbi:hypothetical protein N7536_008962 [Penicillium majusculum]|uniref:Uncharacterized protein n=1 Tax=Penicillium solitum TaxID=60172 RepID=A0A1V6R088_9EURO|nr:uncharacterized protein PENSOL_c024G09754 [Penicillium solitum]KAJ5686343.1 hypothetical protein N7536_008962 [Penicillium majusculum]OQD94791.1 hypothetical protein PENSOL_c024G09754 [Penicillium solitum]
MLCTLAMIKRQCVYNPRLSTGSIRSTDIAGKEYLSGVVAYSLWFGMPENYETNLVMVEAKKTEAVDSGMFQCLTYMAIIHHARKKAKMKDTSVYGIAPDS